MTARFGRNKRRRAREAVAHAEANVRIVEQSLRDTEGSLRGLLALVTKERDLAQQRLADIGNRIMVATSSISGLLPIGMAETQSYKPYDVRWPIPTDLATRVRPASPGDYPLGNAIMDSQSYLYLQHLVLFVEKHRYQFKTIVRFENRAEGYFGKNEVRLAYAVSDDALRKIGFHSDTRHLAIQIANELANYTEAAGEQR